MKRLNASDAFSRQPPSEELRSRLRERDEAVVLSVRGGEVTAAARAGTSDERVLHESALVKGALRLETGRVLTFRIHRPSGMAAYRDESADGERHRQLPGGSGPHTAEDIMTREVLTTSPDMLVEDVAKLLAFHNVSGMPVEDWDGRVIGIISEADVLGKIGDTIRDVMSEELVSVSRSTPIEEIATLLVERRIKRVPVIADEGLVGIVSRADIVRALAERAYSPTA